MDVPAAVYVSVFDVSVACRQHAASGSQFAWIKIYRTPYHPQVDLCIYQLP